ncbi:ABC transporter substrate-binding protein [Natribaculum luteum]|uniref:ABC transporter substrate-binding protein n=1 Tax=Natribaculum luteum TaxID=1586232 RepID=A0ABD5P1T7_9EURY|nr:ABC transporter substrate-binding protein [Natribaculum luteum]
MGGGNGEAIEALGNTFQEETGIEVEMVYQGSYEDTLNQSFAAIEAGTMPEIVQIDSLHAKQILDTDAFQSVEGIMPDDYPFDNFLDPVTDFFTIDGELYSMPFNNSNAILYYNKDVFDEAGLDPESPPETLEEVMAYSRDIVDSGAAEYGITWPNHVWFLEHWYSLDGQTLVDNENGWGGDPTTVHTETETGEALWSWWREMAQDGLYTNPGMEAWGEAADLFYGQNAAMMLTSTASVAGAIEQSEAEGFELGTGFYPAIDDREGVVIGGASLWVPDGMSESRANEVGQLLEFMTQPENQIQWHQDTGYYPVRQEAVDQLEDEGWFEESPHHGTAFDQLLESEQTTATKRMLVGPARQVSVQLQEGSVEIFDEQAGLEEGLATMKENIESEMERYVDARGS